MAEDSDLEKTEQPSSRRLEQAREEGQVPQSRELSTFLVMIAGVAGMWLLGGWIGERMLGVVRRGFTFERQVVFDNALMLGAFRELLTDALLTVMPLFGVLMLAAVGAPMLMGGFVFAPKVLGLKLDRLDPIKGFGRMFSLHGAVELVKSTLKAALVGSVGAWAVWRERDHVFALMTQPVEASMPDFVSMVLFASLLIVLSLGLLALIDVPYQLWEYNRKLRMTKEEVKRENKEQEGDPQIKVRIRRAQMEVARRRMMANVPKADVVVTNPTHFSVALKYDAARMGAPVVVAKGRGETALKIRELAKEHKVPMLEAPPLARALYAHCDLEAPIPGALFTAVAEVLAYVYQLNHWIANGGMPPETPSDLPVPEGMDPGAED